MSSAQLVLDPGLRAGQLLSQHSTGKCIYISVQNVEEQGGNSAFHHTLGYLLKVSLLWVITGEVQKTWKENREEKTSEQRAEGLIPGQGEL